jgi:prepilin-type N-terminal cleavage/methylation domain-containing protein
MPPESSALRPPAAGIREAARPRGFTRGFTLLEVLLGIALIALLGGVLVGSSSQLLSPQPSTPHAVFWKAVQEARKTALKSDHEIRLKYDREKKHFYLVDGLAPSTLAEDGFTRVETPLKTFPIAAETAQDLTIDFLAASSKGGNTILVGGMLLESKPVPYVSFYSDGTCRAFRAQFARSGSSSILSIDPWTCAPVLPAADPNAP